MKITIAGDHYTVDLLKAIEQQLSDLGHVIINVGSQNQDDKKTLQEIIPAVASAVTDRDADFGVLACGTGVGVEIGANRFKGVRASLCRDPQQAKNARIYDNANILCLGSWYKDDFVSIIEAWIENKFGGDAGRTQMLADFDNF